MFELSDDDDNFWDDVPLGDITNLRQSETTVEDPVSGLRKPSLGDTNPAKRPCVSRNVPTGISMAEEVAPVIEPTSFRTRVMTASNNERFAPLASKTTSLASDPGQGNQTPLAVASRERFTTPVGTSGRATPGSTPRRPKRKFPGPAGLLPELQPGQSMDSVSITGVTVTDPDKSNKDDTVILSSQSSDDVFLDTPWQTLLSDLGDEDAQLLTRFSIASISLKASKKQLVKGKVAMVFAVIECMDTHGSDASITLRDKSGRIQGTVHRDLLKDYEAELQPGTVLVLRQVSVISLTNKSHYLNITPSNIVVLYQNKNSQLQKVKFHGSQDSLRSILVSLERKANQELADQNSSHGTPGSVNSSRLSSVGRNSSTSTPVLFNAMLNETMNNLRNQGNGPGHFTPRAPGVRDVGVTPQNHGLRDVRFTPSAVRTPNTSVRQNLYPQTTAQTPSGVRVPNPQTPNTSFRAYSHVNSVNTPVSNTNSVRHIFTPGQNASPNVIPQNTPGSSSSYRFNPNPRAGVQITPVSNVSVPNINNQSFNSTIVRNTPVANTSNISKVTNAHQRITQLSNRSMSTSSISANHQTLPTTTASGIQTSTENRSARITPVGNINVSHTANNAASSHVNNVVTPKPVTNNDKTSPVSNINKRKWSFKSPTSSPNLGAAQANVSGQTNIGALRNTSAQINNGARLNSGAQTITNIGQSNDSFKRMNLGQGLNTNLSYDVNRTTPSNRNDNIARNNVTNSVIQRQQIKASVGVAVSVSEQFSSDKNYGDFNNNESAMTDAPNANNIRANTQTVTKSKWSFKSKTVTSPTVSQKSSPPMIGQNRSCDTSTSNQKLEDLWQDDLSNELLSQLSDEMM